MAVRVFGAVTRGVQGLLRRRGLGAGGKVPSHRVQQLFNDMDLFPSKSQVYEMLQCAKECANRSSATYLTFGEFCLFASELKRCYAGGVPRPLQVSRRCLEKKEGEGMEGKVGMNSCGRKWRRRGCAITSSPSHKQSEHLLSITAWAFCCQHCHKMILERTISFCIKIYLEMFWSLRKYHVFWINHGVFQVMLDLA